MKEFRELLTTSVVMFEYEKSDGSTRVARGTLHKSYCPEIKGGGSPTKEHLQIYFDIERNCWRCFKKENFKRIIKTFSIMNDFEKAIKYVRDNVDENVVLCTRYRMLEEREPLYHVNWALSDQIYDLMEEYGQEHNLPEGWWLCEHDEETIFEML